MRVLEHPTRHRRGGRYPTLYWAIVRQLWSEPDTRQVWFADWASVTKGAISQHFSRLDSAVPDWRADPRHLLAEHYLADYPGTKGDLTYWLGGEDPMTAARRLSHAGMVISADPAADLLAPWRVPTHTVVYSPDGLTDQAMGELGLTMWEPEHATVALITVPADIWLLRQTRLAGITGGKQGVTVGHPLQIAYDLVRLGGDDRAEARSRLLSTPFALGFD